MNWPRWAQYTLALGAVGAAVLSRWQLGLLLDERIPFLLTFAVLMPLAFLVRSGPFIAAAAAGWTASWYLFIPPEGSFALAGTAEAAMAVIFAFAVVATGMTAWVSRRYQKRVRDARRAAEMDRERLRLVADAMPALISYVDAQERYVFTNKAYKDWFGREPDYFSGRRLREVVGEAAYERIRGHVGAALAGERVHFEGELPYKDAGRRHVRAEYVPDVQSDGSVAGYYALITDVTEQKRISKALRDIQQFNTAVLNSLSAEIALLDGAGRIVAVNERWKQSAEAVEQAPPDRVGAGANYTDVWRKAAKNGNPFAAEAVDGIEQVLEGRTDEYRIEYSHQSAERQTWFRMYVIRPSGNGIGAIVLHTDITEQKRAEEAQARLAAIVETSSDAIISKSLHGVIQSWNIGAERLFGYTPAEVIGRSIDIIIPAELREQEQQVLHRLRHGESPEPFETVRVTKDGRRIDISLNVSPIRDRTGRTVGASSVARDITHRKRSEQALLESEARYRAVLESQSEMVCRFRPDGSILFANRAYAEARNTTPEAVREMNFWNWISETDRPAVRTLLENLSPANPEARIENRFETGDGVRWTLWTNRALAFDEQGRAVEIQSTGIDITGRKLAEANLLRSEEALRDADRRKDEFLATLAHELRNPLAPIRIAATILRKSRDNPEQLAATTAMIERQSSQLQRLIDDLLDLSRITRGRIELRRQITDIAPVISQAVESARLLSEHRKIQLDVALPAQPIRVNADPVRLVQIVGNLLNNAFKYTEAGGRIRVVAQLERGQAVIRVQDTGIGIAPNQLPHIFDKFTQVTDSLHRSQGGLGIGLPLAKSLAELHGGAIEAHSAGPRQGSEFVVRLPAAMPSANAADEAGEREAAAADAAHRRRILAVDDNQDALEALSILLRMNGHQVETADNGERAIAVAESFLPEIVFLDLGMPGLSGLDVARRIRQQPWGQDMMLVAMTGWGQEKDKQSTAEAGFDAHLVKPTDIETIEALISRSTPRHDAA